MLVTTDQVYGGCAALGGEVAAVRHANGSGGERGGADLQRRIDGEAELLVGLLAVVVADPHGEGEGSCGGRRAGQLAVVIAAGVGTRERQPGRQRSGGHRPGVGRAPPSAPKPWGWHALVRAPAQPADRSLSPDTEPGRLRFTGWMG